MGNKNTTLFCSIKPDVTIPITLLFLLTIGPPELPWFKAASVCYLSSYLFVILPLLTFNTGVAP